MAEPAEILVSTPAELSDFCAQLQQCPRLGLDTEFVGEDSYHPRLCLVQVAIPDGLFLIDPFTTGPLDDFWKIITDPTHQVIVHAGREEVRLCHLWSGQTPGCLFDLQIAAGLVGFPYPLGHAPLVQQVLSKRVPKNETLTEWRNRPLSPAQISYAFDDVRYMLALWENLSGKLEKLGRAAWAEEEFSRLRQLATPEEPGLAPGADRWRRLRGAGSLERRRLAVLRELYTCREQLAAQANRPARTIVRDDLLVEIARRNPKTERDLAPIRGLPKKYLTPLFEAVERGRAQPPETWPAAAERDIDPPQVAWIVNLLAAVLGDFAVRNLLAANLVASNTDLRLLVRARLLGKAYPAESLLTEGWRAQHVLPHVLAILEGKRGLRVDNLSDTPFTFVE